MQQGEGSEAQVTWEDQQNINKFGRLNNRFHELEDEIKLAKESNESLEDASNELILSDEDVVRFQIGRGGVRAHATGGGRDPVGEDERGCKQESGEARGREGIRARSDGRTQEDLVWEVQGLNQLGGGLIWPVEKTGSLCRAFL